MPLPKIDDLFALLRGAKYFTALDLCSGYYHIKLDKDSISKNAFTTVFSKFKFLDYSLDYLKAQTSSFILSMTFLNLTRPQTKAKPQDT